MAKRRKKTRRTVVESRGSIYKDGWDYRLMLVDCNKPRCRPCKGGPSHGPYWYAEQHAGKVKKKYKTRTIYIGRKLMSVAAKAKKLTAKAG